MNNAQAQKNARIKNIRAFVANKLRASNFSEAN
jgi:hypothetical protein